jgi:chemotaxis protein CheD
MYMIGDRNITMAFQMLEEFRIPVIAKDIGGQIGRKIIMNTATGVVLVGKGKRDVSNG